MNKRGLYFFVLACLIGLSSPSFSQKNKRHKKKSVISEKTLREAEYLFAEGQKYFILEDYAKAMVVFNQCLELTPDNAAVHFKLAELQAQNEKYEDAASHALRAIELDNNNKYYYILAASIRNQQGQHDKAAELYETMLGKIPHADNYYFDLAAIYLYQKRYDDALSAYDRAEKALGVDESIAYQKQKIYLQLNQLQKATQEGEKLIENYPENPQHSTELAKLLVANGKNKYAKEVLEKSIITHPNDGQTLVMLADLYKTSGELSAYEQTIARIYDNREVDTEIKVQLLAESIYKIAQARSGNNPNRSLETSSLENAQKLTELHQDARIVAVYGDLLYTIDEKEKALEQYLKSVDLDDSNFQTWQNILQLESDLGRNSDLVSHAERALESFPNQAVIYMYMGLAQLQLNAYQEAAETLEIGKKLSIQNQAQIAIFSSLLGSAYNGSKNYSKSDHAYEEALSINPNDDQTLNNYSYFLSLRQENLESAENMAKKVVSISPNNATYLDTYAWVLYMRKKYKEAKIQIEKAIALEGTSAEHFNHYGDILYQLGEVDKAVVQWKKAKSMDDSLDNIDKKIETRSVYE